MSPDARCSACGGEAFRIAGEGLVCAACGGPGPRPPAGELAELRRELDALREDLARLRRAVNFLHQRVR